MVLYRTYIVLAIIHLETADGPCGYLWAWGWMVQMACPCDLSRTPDTATIPEDTAEGAPL